MISFVFQSIRCKYTTQYNMENMLQSLLMTLSRLCLAIHCEQRARAYTVRLLCVNLKWLRKYVCVCIHIGKI